MMVVIRLFFLNLFTAKLIQYFFDLKLVHDV